MIHIHNKDNNNRRNNKINSDRAHTKCKTCFIATMTHQ